MSILAWAFALGGLGFAAGFFEPMVLDPSSGSGPLLGLFITGPGGFVLGLLVGAWRRWRGAGSKR
jgi:hypothetical protein